MGNDVSVKQLCLGQRHKKNKFSRICRVLGSYCADDPEVESLRLPFRCCRLIFCGVCLPDLSSCMLVCKEWLSIIDTCTFWKSYINTNYDFKLADPGPLSPLLSWTTPTLLPAQPPAVFHPPLDLWACRIVVPYAVSPPIGSIECHHNFLHALCWLQTLRYQLDCFHFAPTVEVCLFPWYRERMPTASEILLIFNCHFPAEATNTAPPVLPPGNFGLYFSQFCTVHPGVGWDTAFLEWFPRQLGGSSLAFVCDVPRSTPAPCFVVTTIAPGWIGGMMYAS